MCCTRQAFYFRFTSGIIFNLISQIKRTSRIYMEHAICLLGNNSTVLTFTATKIKMKGKSVGGITRPIPPQLLEIVNTVAELEGDVRLYVEMLISESDNEAR